MAGDFRWWWLELEWTLPSGYVAEARRAGGFAGSVRLNGDGLGLCTVDPVAG